MFSANDRSRWATVASLVEHRTWSLDRLLEHPGSVEWDTIDKVRHADSQGVVRSYSSKPPLLSAVVAGEYWLLHQLTGWKITNEPGPVIRTLLTVNHCLCLLVLLGLLASFLEPLFVSDWTRYFVVAVAGWGTFLTSFAVTLNNHLPAATVCMAVVWLTDRQLRGIGRSWTNHCLLGLLAAVLVAFELPAAAFSGMVALILFFRGPTRFLTGFVPGAAAVAAAVIGLNYSAHGTWRPAYSFRSDGPVLTRLTGDFSGVLAAGTLPEEVRLAVETQRSGRTNTPTDLMRVEPGSWMGTLPAEQASEPVQRWIITDSAGNGCFALIRGEQESWELREWGNWYDYPGSYWRSGGTDRRSRIDRGEADPLVYAFHFLIGHHGILSLTPVWLLAWAGLLPLATSRVLDRRWLGMATVIVTVVVLAFYLTKPMHDRNYGGWTSGPRWVFWMAPLWLASMVPVVQMLARWKWGRTLCLVLLAASMLSAMYSWQNPWVQPWLYQFWMMSEGVR